MMRQSDKPTYLLVLPWPLSSIGGVTQVVMNLYRECERSGKFSPLIMILDFAQSAPAFEVIDGFRCVRLGLAAPANDGWSIRGMLAFARRAPVTMWRLRRLLSSLRVAAVNAHYPTLSIVNFLLLRRLRLLGSARLLLSFHGADIRNADKQGALEKRLWRWMMRESDRFVLCSDSLRGDVVRLAPGSDAKIATVRNAVDIALVKEGVGVAGNRSSADRTRSYVLNIATFEHKKGQDVLLEAFANLADDHPSIDLVIVGRDAAMRPRIEQIIRERRLEQRVRCMVDIAYADTLRTLSSAMLLVLPSRSEGLPLVILEAGALGIPVVATHVDGIPEVIERDDLGVLVPPENAKALEAALRSLIGDADRRARLGASLHAHVASAFSWDRAWAQYMALVA